MLQVKDDINLKNRVGDHKYSKLIQKTPKTKRISMSIVRVLIITKKLDHYNFKYHL